MTQHEQAPPEPSVRTPFRILPSRRRNLSESRWLVGGSAAMLLAGFALSVTGNDFGALLLFAGIFGIVIGVRWRRREERYFGPDSEYWLEIATDHFGLITPDTTDICPWSEISAFEVVETPIHNRRGQHIDTAYSAMAVYRRYHLEISLDDFATGLGRDDKRQAFQISAILNRLRESALAADGGDFDYAPPVGLVVTDKSPRRQSTARPILPVIRRQ